MITEHDIRQQARERAAGIPSGDMRVAPLTARQSCERPGCAANMREIEAMVARSLEHARRSRGGYVNPPMIAARSCATGKEQRP